MKDWPTLNTLHFRWRLEARTAGTFFVFVRVFSSLVVVALCFSSSICFKAIAQQANSVHEIAGGAFTFSVPADWVFDDSGLGGVAVILASPDSRTNVSLSISRVGTIKLADRVGEFRRKVGPPDSLYDDSAAEVGGVQGHSFSLGPEGGRPDKRFVLVIADEREYDFLLITRVDSFAKANSDFTAILKSVSWKKKTDDTTYQAKDGSFSLSVPRDYIVVEGGASDPKIVLLAPFIAKYAASMAVNSYPLGDATLDSFVAGRRVNRDMKLSAVEIEDRPYVLFAKIPGPPTSERSRSLNGQQARQLMFRVERVSLPPPQEHDPTDFSLPPTTTVIVKELFIQRGREIWMFTMNSTEGVFSRYEQDFEQILRSIKWKEKE